MGQFPFTTIRSFFFFFLRCATGSFENQRSDQFATIPGRLTGTPETILPFEVCEVNFSPLISVKASDDLLRKIQCALFPPATRGLATSSPWVNVSQLLHGVAMANLGMEDRGELESLAMKQLAVIPNLRANCQETRYSSRFWAIATLCAMYVNSPNRRIHVNGQEWILRQWSYTTKDSICLVLENAYGCKAIDYSWEGFKRRGSAIFSLQNNYFFNSIFD